MSDHEKSDESALEWLKLKTDRGQKPDFEKKAEIENVSNKFLRKFKDNPFVPIGKSFGDYNLVYSTSIVLDNFKMLVITVNTNI